MKHAAVTFVLAALAFNFVSLSASAKGDAAQCQKELRANPAPWGTEQAKAELAKADCEQRSVLCVDASGYPLPTERSDPSLKSGETLTVKLFGPKSCQEVLTVSTNLHQSDVTLFKATPANKGIERVAAVEIEQLAKATVTTDVMTDSVTIFVSRLDSELTLEGITLTVTPPRYYLDVGLLAAFTPQYQRVSTQRSPGSEEQFIRETNTVRAAAAITVNFFPWGQYSAPRFSGYHGLAIQAGIGGDLDRIDDEFYTGILWEPIPGAGVSAGLALLEMQRLQDHYPSGTLVKPGDVPSDTFLGPRFYFGISLNTQVFQTVLSLGAKARVPN